jgi:hypothetical protein
MTPSEPTITTIGELSDAAIDAIAALLVESYFSTQEINNAPAIGGNPAEALGESANGL